MAEKQKYEIIWKKGGWFEKDHFVLKRLPSASDNAMVNLIMIGAIIAVILFILSFVLLTAPLWCVIVGFQMTREKRYYAGIAALIGLIYFYVDIEKEWLTAIIFNGYTDNEGNFISGFSPSEAYILSYIQIINYIATGLGMGFIFDSILISKYGKKFSDNKITTPQIATYSVPILLAFILSTLNPLSANPKRVKLNKIPVVNTISDTTDYKEAVETYVDTSSSTLDSLQLTEMSVENIEIVQIGNQIWSQENLNVSEFRNGDPIFEARTLKEWKQVGEEHKPAWCYYGNDSSNGEKFGKLYNWYAINDSRGLAPEGWHIPSDEEWILLIDYLGGEDEASSKIKSKKGWEGGANGNNNSGFTSLPAGNRGSWGKAENDWTDAEFQNKGDGAEWWSSTQSSFTNYGISYGQYHYTKISRNDLYNKTVGKSVRCVKN